MCYCSSWCWKTIRFVYFVHSPWVKESKPLVIWYHFQKADSISQNETDMWDIFLCFHESFHESHFIHSDFVFVLKLFDFICPCLGCERGLFFSSAHFSIRFLFLSFSLSHYIVCAFETDPQKETKSIQQISILLTNNPAYIHVTHYPPTQFDHIKYHIQNKLQKYNNIPSPTL